ncbi:MAG: KEOPS complex subunit Pcc1 [Candidatus Nanohaloarchaea archaeon]|nr:KEOPS complex subunit Pcc1 [Candidatus Nanohaloarchaea archaeon]
MEATLRLDVDKPEKVHTAIKPDLGGSDRVSFDVSVDDDNVVIDIETDSLGVLRGTLNTTTRLTKLSSKFV